MAASAEIWPVLSYYALNPSAVRQVEPIGSGGGWSGARLWKLAIARGRTLCLRRWPQEHPSEDRLRLIHRVLLGVEAGGVPYVPAPQLTVSGATFIEHVGHLWELTPWQPGQADFDERPSGTRLRAAMRALAGFHQASTRVIPVEQGRAPALIERSQRAAALQSSKLQVLAAATATGLSPNLDTRANAILRFAPSLLASLQPRLDASRTSLLPLQPAIRDIHREHVLFTGDEVTGIVDFGALRIDTPLTDIARLVGSLVGDDLAARRVALDAYSAIIPLSDADRQLIDLLDESGLLLGSLNWLDWLYVERRDMGDFAPITARLDEMITRLERSAR